VSEPTELRIRRLVRELLTVRLDPFVTLLAEEEVPVDEQRRRLDTLVRALQQIEVDSTLSDRGRPVPVKVDADSKPPKIRVHRKLIDKVDADADLLLAFHQPIAQILEVSPVGVGLVLQCRDERQLKSLAKKAARQLESEKTLLTQVPAVVEQRMNLFEERLGEFAERFGDSVFLLLSGSEEFGAKLSRASGGWPDWTAVEKSSFMKGAVDEIVVALEGIDGAPPAALLVELCWESLDLSAQSFLRHAAQKLRAQQTDLDVESALRRMAQIVEPNGGGMSRSVGDWGAYGDLSTAWDDLFREEQRLLAWTPGRRSTPAVSVFGAPLRTMRMCEPESLPWEAPLLSWSMRERNALRDLLRGMHQTLLEHRTNTILEAPEILVDSDETLLDVDGGDVTLNVQVASGEQSLPDDYEALLGRALNACQQSMLAQFDRLEPSQKSRVLQTLRSAYGGYFGEAKQVWKRRFQAWKKWDEREAFTILSTELRHVLGPAIIFDAFQDPRETELRMVPTFTVVVPRPEGVDRTMLHVPLTALRNTFQDTPVRVRVVDVGDDDEPCTWGGDVEVTLQTIEDYATEMVLKSIENDSVRLLVYESLMSTGRIG
jgi:hypothetical protein